MLDIDVKGTTHSMDKDRIFPPLSLGTSTFSALRLNGEIYVDKTRLIYSLCSKPGKVFWLVLVGLENLFWFRLSILFSSTECVNFQDLPSNPCGMKDVIRSYGLIFPNSDLAIRRMILKLNFVGWSARTSPMRDMRESLTGCSFRAGLPDSR